MQPGDTIYSIARRHSLTTSELTSINPGLTEQGLVVGTVLQLPPPPDGRPAIEINGYAYPNSDQAFVLSTLQYMTYLSIICSRVTIDGYLVGVHNAQMIEMCWQNHVAPVMVVANTSETGLYSSALIHAVMSNPAAQERLIHDIVTTVTQNNYYGANIDFEFIPPGDYPVYINFLNILQAALDAQGKSMFIVIRMATLVGQQELLTELLPPSGYEKLADRFIIRVNEWACNTNLEASMLDLTQQAIDFAIGLVPPSKLIIGIPNCCFRWEVPYHHTTPPAQLTVAQADRIATEVGASFQLDSKSGASYFQYIDDLGNTNIVWCANRCTNQSILELVRIYGLGGVTFRTIEDFPITDYQAINATFNIQKVV